MKDILTVVKKEFWELRYSFKRLAILGVVFIFPFMAYNAKGSIFLSAPYVPLFMVLLTAVGGIGHITSDSILSEKKSKTFEVLLSTRLSPLSLVIGKIIPGFIVGLFLALIILLILIVFKMININEISFILVVNTLLFTFSAGLIFYITTLCIPDEKVVQMSAVLVLILILGLLKILFMLNLNLYYAITTPVLLFINAILAVVAQKLLIKSKMFLKI